jgi:REP element-mobilizing transposase RayT
MGRFKRYQLPNRSYFVSSATRHRTPLFRDRELAAIVVQNLLFYRRRGDYLLHAYVVMPDHIHALITPVNGSISDNMRNVKSYITKEIRERRGITGEIWPRFHDRVIRNDQHFADAVAYIHSNPVRAGITRSPLEYEFSSAAIYDEGRSEEFLDLVIVNVPPRKSAVRSNTYR